AFAVIPLTLPWNSPSNLMVSPSMTPVPVADWTPLTPPGTPVLLRSMVMASACSIRCCAAASRCAGVGVTSSSSAASPVQPEITSSRLVIPARSTPGPGRRRGGMADIVRVTPLAPPRLSPHVGESLGDEPVGRDQDQPVSLDTLVDGDAVPVADISGEHGLGQPVTDLLLDQATQR